MTINQSGWRPEAPLANGAGEQPTFTGNRALMLEEPLLFEIGSTERTGVDFETPSPLAGEGGGEGTRGAAELPKNRLGGLERGPINLPGLSEPETVRHYTRLSRQNYAIDLGVFPLGSCTM
jgi:glycine dehydrogenase subunit 2